MENNIVFYGERGFVNALVLDIHNDLNLIKNFLSSIHFCGGRVPSWIENVKDVSFFIEPSFAQFGDPDLLILCGCEDEKHLIFLEAKVEPYELSAISIKDLKECIESYKKSYESKKNLKSIGINSRINTQLTLKYRLSRLLTNRKKGSQIKEGKLWNVYLDNSLDSINHPRQLKKDLNIKLCDDYLMGINDFWFVGLTSDTIPFEPYKDQGTRPFIYNEGGINIWDKLSDHFGLVTYDDLNQILTEGINYKIAKKYFEVNKISQGVVKNSVYSIKPENWNNFSPYIKEQLCESIIKNIKGCIRELSVEEEESRYEYYEIERYNGSTSFKIGPQTVISLFPYRKDDREGLMVSLRMEHFNDSFKNEFNIGPFMFGAVNKRQFMGKFIEQSAVDNGEEFSSIIKDYWKNCFI